MVSAVTRRARATRAGRIARAATLLLGTALVAACSGGGPAAPAGATVAAVVPTPSTAPVATIEVTFVASPSPAPVDAATPAPSVPPTPVPGTGKITVTEYRFAITLPAGWRQVPVDGSGTDEIEAQLPADSELAAALESEVAKAAKEGFALLAVDLRRATLAEGLSSLTVLAAGPSNVPLSLMESLVVGLLDGAAGISSVSSKIVTLPAGKAIRATYTITATSSTGKTVKSAGTAFVLLSSKHTYTVSFACPSSIASSCRSQADAIMKTFDIL